MLRHYYCTTSIKSCGQQHFIKAFKVYIAFLRRRIICLYGLLTSGEIVFPTIYRGYLKEVKSYRQMEITQSIMQLIYYI